MLKTNILFWNREHDNVVVINNGVCNNTRACNADTYIS